MALTPIQININNSGHIVSLKSNIKKDNFIKVKLDILTLCLSLQQVKLEI